jgi:hypothetical protein
MREIRPASFVAWRAIFVCITLPRSSTINLPCRFASQVCDYSFGLKGMALPTHGGAFCLHYTFRSSTISFILKGFPDGKEDCLAGAAYKGWKETLRSVKWRIATSLLSSAGTPAARDHWRQQHPELKSLQTLVLNDASGNVRLGHSRRHRSIPRASGANSGTARASGASIGGARTVAPEAKRAGTASSSRARAGKQEREAPGLDSGGPIKQ